MDLEPIGARLLGAVKDYPILCSFLGTMDPRTGGRMFCLAFLLNSGIGFTVTTAVATAGGGKLEFNFLFGAT